MAADPHVLQAVVEAAFAAYVAAAVASASLKGRFTASLKVSSALTAAGSALLVSVPALALGSLGSGLTVALFGLKIYVDYLTAVFLTIVALLGFATSIYTPAYMRHYRRLGYGWLYGVLHPAFIASMALVILAEDLLTFIVAWEIMTFTSYLLIVWERDRAEVRAAGLKYFITMHVLSTLPLIIAVAYAGSAYGTYDILKLAAAGIANPALYALFLVGFAAKAGVVPFHFWLPEAHPAAPSNASALLSGAMIKVAVYGLLRMTCFMMPCNQVFGYVIATVGTITLAIGTLYALRQTDGKRLLAYHSVGQMGYIWLGLGVGIIFIPMGGAFRAFGIAALVAGLFHAVNHALFKGSLFLGAGSVLFRTGTKDLNVLGGLARLMPATSVFTAIAALSIAGVPPLNGFLSKWLIYQVTFLSGNAYLAFCGVMALFISAATLASFAKFYTSIFGGEVRRGLEGVREVPKSMLAGQGMLSALCIVFGVAPFTVIPVLAGAGGVLAGLKAAQAPITSNYLAVLLRPEWVPQQLRSYYMPAVFATALSLGVLGLYWGVRSRVRASPSGAWLCGYGYMRVEGVKMVARNYYRAFEEGIEGLYHAGASASVKLGSLATSVARAYVRFAEAVSRVGRVGRVFTAFADYYVRRVRSDYYLDEALWRPLQRLVTNLYRVLRGKSFNTIAYCLAVAVALLAALVIIAEVMGVGWG